MTTVEKPPHKRVKKPRKIVRTTEGGELRVSRYEKAASTLLAILLCMSAIAAILFLVFLASRPPRRLDAPPVAFWEKEGSGRGDHAAGFARDAEFGTGEVEQFDEPAARMPSKAPSEAIADAVSSVANSLLAVDATPGVATSGVPGGTGVGSGGTGVGRGDDRLPGPLGDGVNAIPRSERWQIQYPSSNLKQYARILDFFQIELGVIGGGRPAVEYAANFSTTATKRSGPPDQEKRLYMTWRSGEMKQAELQLLTQAGVNSAGAIQVQFLSPEAESQLEQAEAEAKGKRSIQEVQKTVFGVRPQGNGFEFFVIEQRYRVAS